MLHIHSILIIHPRFVYKKLVLEANWRQKYEIAYFGRIGLSNLYASTNHRLNYVAINCPYLFHPPQMTLCLEK